MDPITFDRMAQHLAAGASRRGVVRGALAAAAGSALLAFGQASAGADEVSTENCTPEGKRCGKGKRRRPCKKCCTKNVILDQNGKRRCSCVRLGNGCTNDSQCCEGICDSGTCQVTGPTCVPLQVACVAGDICCTGICEAARDACCIATDAVGCTVAADCCDVEVGCNLGTCELV